MWYASLLGPLVVLGMTLNCLHRVIYLPHPGANDSTLAVEAPLNNNSLTPVACMTFANAARLSTSLSRTEGADCVEIENNSTPGSRSDTLVEPMPSSHMNASSESAPSTPLGQSTGRSVASQNDSTPRRQLNTESTTQSQSTGVSGKNRYLYHVP